MSGYLTGFETGLANTERIHSHRLQAEQSLQSTAYTIVVQWTPETFEKYPGRHKEQLTVPWLYA